ncbi:MAG TPA: hypothetical protein VMH22_10070 [bacterium]|nr:hypothetical protein [bacterium]
MALKTDAEIRQGFDSDQFVVKRTVTWEGMRGYAAEHKTAKNTATGKPKKAFYVEGNGYQMGHLMGQLAEPDVRRMTSEFVDKIVLAFIDPKLEGLERERLYRALMHGIKDWCQIVYTLHPNDIPEPLRQEMQGIVDGCKYDDSTSPVTFQNLLSLNVGVDVLVSAIYTGLGILDWVGAIVPKMAGSVPGLTAAAPPTAELFRVPLNFGCNAFAAFGNAVAAPHNQFFFGRDFQFPTADVFQDTACLVVYNPSYSLPNGQPALPLVSQTAPGFAGSVTAVNSMGVGIGVDMVPSGNCDPGRPGLNSLLMVRYAAHSGYGAAKTVDAIVAAQRGASWLYPIGDGTNKQAVVCETGVTTGNLNYLGYPPAEIKHLLPTTGFQPSQRGVFARWNGWQYPAQYQQYNPGLFNYMKRQYDPAKFGEHAYLNPNWKPGPTQVDEGYFFAPQRESKPDLLVVTNHYLVPEMRLCAMKEWTNVVAKSKMPDVLWRYDELNSQCLANYGSIDYPKALELIDFLSPFRKFPDYYGANHVIEGSVSLCDLVAKTMESHFGYQEDEWVKLALPKYIN